MRYTLIVASTEYEFSSGYCRVFHPDLAVAEMRWPATTAISGRLFFARVWCAVLLVGGLRDCEKPIKRSYFRPPPYNRCIPASDGCWKSILGSGGLRLYVPRLG